MVVFWVVIPCGLIGYVDNDFLLEHIFSIFRVKDIMFLHVSDNALTNPHGFTNKNDTISE
jgi:hypothetical protein